MKKAKITIELDNAAIADIESRFGLRCDYDIRMYLLGVYAQLTSKQIGVVDIYVEVDDE